MTKIITKLDELYSLREDFSIIGLTGRTGSGCSDVAKILNSEFKSLEGLVKPGKVPLSIQERKYEIVYNFNKINWKQYKIIEYKNVLLLLLIHSLNKVHLKDLLYTYFKKSERDIVDNNKIENLYESLYKVFKEYDNEVKELKSFQVLGKIKLKKNLLRLGNFYWNGRFQEFAKKVDKELKINGIIERIYLLHQIASNFREYGNALSDRNNKKFDNIYHIANVINRLIKATKVIGKGKCHIVIDSLRNSSEINFFKERYSGFYLAAVKSDERKYRLLKEYVDKDLVEKLLELDETEYKCNDFVKGDFFAPDVQNCIQKSDFHIITTNNESNLKDFISLDQQLIKLQGLIQQPGLITPSTIERCMQFAFNVKLSSGCISRQVGAVITDKEYSVKAIGWNDVPRGAVPCAVRNVKELGTPNAFGFSDFEKGQGLIDNKANPDDKEMEKESKNYHQFVLENYNKSKLKESDLGGINCPYCFKTAYNKFKGEANQVHTRSLHAEENAMLQISKYGGQPLNNGILFTTASPCELCSKKAYQLGIRDIYYIDPYPGISRSHILKQGILSETIGDSKPISPDPNLYMFYGAIGRGFIKLYEPFMSQKDEISILTNLKVNTPEKVKAIQLKEFVKDKIKDNEELVKKLDRMFDNGELNLDKLVKLIENGLNEL